MKAESRHLVDLVEERMAKDVATISTCCHRLQMIDSDRVDKSFSKEAEICPRSGQEAMQLLTVI